MGRLWLPFNRHYMYRYKLYIAVMYTVNVMIQTSLMLKNFENLTRKKEKKRRKKENEVRSQKVKLRPQSLH